MVSCPFPRRVAVATMWKQMPIAPGSSPREKKNAVPCRSWSLYPPTWNVVMKRNGMAAKAIDIARTTPRCRGLRRLNDADPTAVNPPLDSADREPDIGFSSILDVETMLDLAAARRKHFLTDGKAASAWVGHAKSPIRTRHRGDQHFVARKDLDEGVPDFPARGVADCAGNFHRWELKTFMFCHGQAAPKPPRRRRSKPTSGAPVARH